MRSGHKARWVFALWAIAAVFIGAVLTSLHQPFRSPSGNVILSLAGGRVGGRATGQWRAIHLLSGGCGCSQRVLRNLLTQAPVTGVAEQILMVDDEADYLPGSAQLLDRLLRLGFPIRHISAGQLPPEIGLSGVPLLVLASPDGQVAYTGGYGPQGDQEQALLLQARSGDIPRPLPLVGCAVGARLKRQADPFSVKN